MGKGGGALSMWIKEFTALVFTQTIQAFIYAIIITIILYGMVQTGSDISSDDNNAALGLMSTFALLSVFKVEEMAKKIFGVGDTKASHGNAMKSIAKTAIAAQLGKRVLDNAGKVFGGVRAINKSRQDNKKTQKRLQEDMEDNGFVMGENGKPTYVGTKKTRSSTNSSAAASVTTNGAGGANVSTPTAVDVANSGGSGVAVGADEQIISDAAQRRMRNALRNYDDKVSEIKKAREEGIKNIFTGVSESIGAGFGAATGAVLGGADGDLDEMLQGMMAGAGVGDAAAQSAVNAIDRATQFVKRNAKHEAGISSKQLQKSIDAYKDALSKTSVNYASSKVDDIDI